VLKREREFEKRKSAGPSVWEQAAKKRGQNGGKNDRKEKNGDNQKHDDNTRPRNKWGQKTALLKGAKDNQKKGLGGGK